MVKSVADRLKRTIKHNFFAKIMSVVFSVVLWLFVMENANPTIERTYTLPIEVANAADDYEYQLGKRSIKIKVFAKRVYFATLDTSKMRATIDLESSPKKGIFNAPVLIELPKGYESVEKSFENVKVTLDPYVHIPIALEIKERGTSSDIAKVANILKQENKVEIRGTAANCSKVHKLVGYVDLAGKDEDFEQDVILIPVDEALNEVYKVKLLNSTIKVKVRMKKSITSKNVSVTPIFKDDTESMQATVNPSFVTIIGEEGVLVNIETIPTEPIENKVGETKANIVLPFGVTSKTTSVTVGVKK